jgi:hypothetical protein
MMVPARSVMLTMACWSRANFWFSSARWASPKTRLVSEEGRSLVREVLGLGTVSLVALRRQRRLAGAVL